MNFPGANNGVSPHRKPTIRQAALDWYQTSHWRSVTDVSLTLKQAYHSPQGTSFIDPNRVEKTFAYFMRQLNRAVYGNAYRRYRKQLRVVAVLEKHEYGHWHIHAAVEPPRHLDHDEFESRVRECWVEKTDWGYDEIKIRPDADSGWIDYMLKLRQKTGLEQWSDCILGTFHNPIADA